MPQESATIDPEPPSSAPISAATAAGVIAEGARFGAYVVGPCIGQAEGSRLYRVEHHGMRGRPVVLKVFTDEFGSEPERRSRFVRRARAAATLRHPSVVDVFDVGEHDGVPYLVRELLDGEDLETQLGARGPLGETAMADLLVPIVAGLSALHDAGIVHGDLRPSSLFVPALNERPQSAKLLDFGMARAFGGDRLVRASGTRGPWRGNPLYFSPEAVRGDELSPASDQYSLGVVMYEAVAGVNPFAADSMLEAVRRVTSGEYPPFRQQAPSASALLARIVERAMQVDARYRYPDIRALGRDLLRLASEPTRVTWALSFPNIVESATVVELSPISLPPEPRSSTAPRLRNTLHEMLGEPPWRDPRAFEWTTAVALLVGLVSFALALAIVLR